MNTMEEHLTTLRCLKILQEENKRMVNAASNKDNQKPTKIHAVLLSSRRRYEERVGSLYGYKSTVTCFNCYKSVHFARNCHLKQKTERSNSKSVILSIKLQNQNLNDSDGRRTWMAGSFVKTLNNMLCVSKSVMNGVRAPETISIDSSTQTRVVNDLEYFIAINDTKEIRLEFSNGSSATTCKIGAVMIETNFERITIPDVFYIPTLQASISPCGKIDKHGFTIKF